MPLIRHHGVMPQVDPTAWVAQDASIIGEVFLGAESSVWFQAVLRGDINAVRIGARTNVQDGSVLHVTNEAAVEIGEGCLVAAGAVVRERTRVPDGVLVAGVPAKIVRELTGEERQGIIRSAVNYVAYAATYRP